MQSGMILGGLIEKLGPKVPNKMPGREQAFIKNTYKTLITRGMKGCYIYCEDKELSKYLKERINKVAEFMDNKDIEMTIHA